MNDFSKDIDIIKKSGVFDASWYLTEYPDVAATDLDPLHHYLWLGARLGRRPSATFDPQAYLEANEDVKRAGVDPLLHYAKNGKKEGRPKQKADVSTLTNTSSDVTVNVRCQRQLYRHRDWWDADNERDFLADLAKFDENETSQKVSIVMPTRNREDTIGKAINSILKQTHENFELIIIDDGSEDRTSEIVQGFSDQRIRYYINSAPQGVSSARNEGLAHCTGDWIFFLDSDNVWYPLMISTMLAATKKYKCDVAYCGMEIVTDDVQAKPRFLFDEFDMQSCISGNYIDLNCFSISKAFLDFRFDTTLKRLVDWDYILRISAHSPPRALPFIGVQYYDGSRYARITKSEYVKNEETEIAISKIRKKAITEITKVAATKPAGHRLAVVVHIYYQDIGRQILSLLSNLKAEFDLFITTPHDLKDDLFAEFRDTFPNVRMFRFANVGSDIGPFMSLLLTLMRYKYVIKAHTKRDTPKWGSTWRDFPLFAILGSDEVISITSKMFDMDPAIKASGSGPFLREGWSNSIPNTSDQTRELATNIGLQLNGDEPWSFFAGTMFWIRPELLLEACLYAMRTPSFSQEFVRDGAIEHAWERIFGLVVTASRGDKFLKLELDEDLIPEARACSPASGTKEGITVTLDKILNTPVALSLAIQMAKHRRIRITTIIPCYNQALLISQAIQSALSQAGNFDHEIIIGDDGSTDFTRKISLQYAQQYPATIRVLKEVPNMGVSANYRRLFEAASGDYVAVLEGDDYWKSTDRLQKCISFLSENRDCSMVFNAIEVHDWIKNDVYILERHKKITSEKLTGQDFLEEPTLNLIGNFSCCVFSAPIMKQVPDAVYDGRINEIALAFYIEKHGLIGFIDEPLSVYRLHKAGIWSGSDRKSQLQSGLRARRAALSVASEIYKPRLLKIIEDKFEKELAKL